ncbi:MAG: MBL fold metallo-hydrolase [Pseudomonadota bacterium]
MTRASIAPRARLTRMLFAGIWACWLSLSAAATECGATHQQALQILGSGGPIADDGRASSSYLVWSGGKAPVMVDTGSGSFLRFGEAGALVSELDFIGLSHLHTDHVGDFPALMKSGSFRHRRLPLVVAGPAGSALFPSVSAYLTQLFDSTTGAYRYLHSYVRDEDAPLIVQEVDSRDVVSVFRSDLMQIDSLAVPHGIVPALAFRVRIGGKTLVFGSDQNGSNDAFIDFVRDADVLVMHLVVPEGVRGPARRLHAAPSRIGEIARDANVSHLVLSHLMARSLSTLDDNLAQVRKRYKGPITVAHDLLCIDLDSSG